MLHTIICLCACVRAGDQVGYDKLISKTTTTKKRRKNGSTAKSKANAEKRKNKTIHWYTNVYKWMCTVYSVWMMNENWANRADDDKQYLAFHRSNDSHMKNSNKSRRSLPLPLSLSLHKCNPITLCMFFFSGDSVDRILMASAMQIFSFLALDSFFGLRWYTVYIIFFIINTT